VSDLAGTDQVWTTRDWYDRFGQPFEPEATGYGQSSAAVASFATTAELLSGYARDVTAATRSYVATLGDDDLDLVVDDSWDPPVTASARLVSVIGDDLKHLGQAEYVAGLL
jgi:hypothetical protein